MAMLRALRVTGGRLLVWWSSGIIAFIIIGWDVVWVRFLVFGSSGHGSRRCRSNYLLGFNYCGICNGPLM
jgi:hypothetical protein